MPVIHSKIQQWLTERSYLPLEYQKEAWSAYLNGESGMINAPTGSGKTLAAWLGPLSEALSNTVPVKSLSVLWITPLRALANDLTTALRSPTEALSLKWRIEQRTADTSSSLRQRQRKQLPQALVTTPESLSLLLSYPESHAQLTSVHTVVVDEWHELLGTKRGTQLELCLAHLRAVNPRLRIWGLSATLPNAPDALRALLGPHKSGRVIRSDLQKVITIETLIPPNVQRFPWAGHLGLAMLEPVIQALERSTTTLLFTNTRSQAEIWYQSIIERRTDWLTQIAIHHGSIDRKVRERVEHGIKNGTLKCVVCTSSLDLGVDFPPVEQVLQIGSPKGIARLRQRAGRCGHSPQLPSRMVCVPTHAWELVEIAAARIAHETGRLENRQALVLPLDVLVQHAVTLATGPGFEASQLLREARDTVAFEALSEQQWHWVLDFITRGGDALLGYPQFRRVTEQQGIFQVTEPTLARRHRMAIGTISSEAAMLVKWLSGGTLGSIEESFITRLRPGDHFIFSGRVLELVHIRDMVAFVRAAKSRRRDVPRWQGSKMPLSAELADSTLELLSGGEDSWRQIAEMRCVLPLLELQALWSAIPDYHTLLIEQLQMRDGLHLFIYPFAGRLANEGLGLLCAARLALDDSQTFAISANEFGFELHTAKPLQIDESRLRTALSTDNLVADLTAALNVSEASRRQFRDIARIAGLVFQGYPGASKTIRQIQASSGLIYDVLQRYDDGNLLLEQARAEVLDAQLQISRIRQRLEILQARQLVLKSITRLTPLAFPLWASHLQSQAVSTESWQQRVERAAAELEQIAKRETH
jgi:ATP-dependent helicase Lhr and Lhr-like helicase